MKKKFISPALQMTYNSGNLTTDQVSRLPEKKLAEYIRQCMCQTYQISSDYILRKIGGSDVIVPVGTHLNPKLESAMLMPNQTAAFLWELFQQPVTEAEAVQKCIEHFDGPPDLIERHICRFIRELIENGILVKTESDNGGK